MRALIPLWAHVALLIAAIALAALVYLRSGEREDGLRKRVHRWKKRFDAAAAERDLARRESTSKTLKLQSQSVELARYRGQLPPELRVTQVMLDEDGKPMIEPESLPKAASVVRQRPKA